ncbi:hypothetical protein BgiMline_033695 [Biomphalaria glabrata]|uniref:Uncharacterized protein LOC106059797 n=1 Tax=Biomphalaria glabrata TaxID=6526 RepID=A0A2C9LCE3_BIOGL|nr:uncharacterized protein LOC106059797 [Biomphalaria glabrata]KAI8739040.1 hypothetical protein BgiMline_024773 [Biomphalaria glabrata]KAI8761383.1 hypothetical protein BgiBS90_031168 [Biomphalaria glabrata]
MANLFNGEQNNQNASESVQANLEGFVANQIRQQEKSAKEDDNLDKEKRDQFIARALAVSKRMNKEIAKAQEKSILLNEEFGNGRITEWRNEHAEEVLSKQQQEPME